MKICKKSCLQGKISANPDIHLTEKGKTCYNIVMKDVLQAKTTYFSVSTDSTSDLRVSYAKERGIFLAPLTFTLEKGEVLTEHLDSYDSDEELTAFYCKLSEGWMPRTAKLNYESHLAHFRAMGEAGVRDALHFTISSGLANTVELARKAAKEVRAEYPNLNIYPVDCLTATGGQGFLVKLAADCRDRGMDFASTIAYIEEAKHRIQHCIIPSDLFYLKKGGRVSTVEAVIGSVLGVKPMLAFDPEGKLTVVEKNKGMKKSFARVLEHMKLAPLSQEERVIVVHTNNPDGANELAKLIKKQVGIEPTIEQMGTVIGAHVGPGSVSCGWFSTKTRAELLQLLSK